MLLLQAGAELRVDVKVTGAMLHAVFPVNPEDGVTVTLGVVAFNVTLASAEGTPEGHKLVIIPFTRTTPGTAH